MQATTLLSLLRPIMTRLRGIMRRGTVAHVDEARRMRELQVRAGVLDVRDRVEHFEPYGFTSSPLQGAEVLLLNVGADRAHTVAVMAADRRHRLLGLNPGDTAVYAADGGHVIVRKGGGIEVASTLPVKISAPRLQIEGDLEVSGDISAEGDVSDGVRSMAGDRQLFNQHTHGGVETGSGTSAPPLPQQ